MSNKEIQNNKYYIDKEGYLQGINIIKYPIARLEFFNANSFKPQAIVLHRTDSSTAKNTLDTWSNPNNAKVGTHFLIDKDGTIYQCASLHKYTQHVGDIKVKNSDINNENYKNKIYKGASSVEKEKQYPNRYPINSDSIGIEVVGKFLGHDKKLSKYDKIFKYTQLSGIWEEATREQKESVKILVDFLKMEYNLTMKDIYEHDRIVYKTSGGGADFV